MPSPRLPARRLRCVLALLAALAAPTALAESLRYRYVPLDQEQLQLPAPYTFFFPSTVVDGRVFGTVYDDTFSVISVAVYDHGKVTIGPAGATSTADERGRVGGSDRSSQAALFAHGVTTLVPRLPGEATASVTALGRGDLALVESIDASDIRTYAYFRRGVETVIDFGLPDPVWGAFMNDAGVVTVTKYPSPTDPFEHGYRYDPRTGTSTLLPPFEGDPTDVRVLVQGINRRGEVLGYSYTNEFGAGYHERIGIWGRDGVFRPYFYQTLNTSLLVFNERDQIVISNPPWFGPAPLQSFLVPAPGTSIDLTTLVTNLPAGLYLSSVVSIDDRGNMVGVASDDEGVDLYPFLLQRLRDCDDDPGRVHVRGATASPAALHALREQHRRR